MNRTRKKKLHSVTERLLDGADLLIDFATLGEYGLEPPQARRRPCESRPRPHAATAPAAHARFGDAIARFERAAA